MAARRSILNWEREEKANQQRNYAAQLQEQVRQKQAKQEKEKARRQQEQREELEMLERERAVATRKHQPHQEATATESSVLVPSPQRTVAMLHVPVVEVQQHGVPMASPLKSVSADPTSPSVPSSEASLPAPTVGSEAYIPAFNSASSVFESILREPGIGARSIAFYDDLAALHKLAAEVGLTSSDAVDNEDDTVHELYTSQLDSAARQRRTEVQSRYVKPDFICQQEVSTTSPTTISVNASHSPARLSDDKIMQQGSRLKKNHREITQPRTRSSLDGLLGESVLLPLTTSKLSPNLYQLKTISRVRESPIKPHLQLSAVIETEDNDMTSMDSLDNYSEMLHFTIARP